MPAAILRLGEVAHFAQLGAAQLQCRINPQIGDVDEFLERHRLQHLACLQQRLPGATRPIKLADEIARRLQALTVLGQFIDDAHRVQFLGLVDPAAENDAFGTNRIEPAGEETVGPHPREHAKQHFWQPEAGTPFGDDDVVRQRRLEAAAKCIALDDRNRADRQLQADGSPMLARGANAGVPLQARPVAGCNQLDEVWQVAAEVEDARHLRCQNQVADGLICVGASTTMRVLYQVERCRHVAQQTRRETGPTGRFHELPKGSGLRFVLNVKLIQARQGRARNCRIPCRPAADDIGKRRVLCNSRDVAANGWYLFNIFNETGNDLMGQHI
ncbi:hypothetical protein DF3PB_1870010 [uncultured Defluviicoccus sp.]|uniref:Uncharacterized protein n=1 Tax=metagenome TaxID=256318 RepID=A0A380TB34_9ZZZZ|nr:hypothetical protein DF3PB_1860010 [uncultured Defluviicoccus sp.]SUS05322.1 hypothetical protein DF3PB_1870010 [uncultured Defluviicoccus sp.]